MLSVSSCCTQVYSHITMAMKLGSSFWLLLAVVVCALAATATVSGQRSLSEHQFPFALQL